MSCANRLVDGFNVLAGADLSGSGGRLMQITSIGTSPVMHSVERATDATLATGQLICGVLEANADSGALCKVVAFGVYEEAVAGGVLTPGTDWKLTTDAQGRFVAATDGDQVCALFLGTVATVAGQRTRVFMVIGHELSTNAAADLAAHLADAAGAHDASAISYTPADLNDWTGAADPGETDDALDQLADRLTAAEADVVTAQATADNHIADAAGAHDASAISYTPADLNDWTGAADPGETDDALDQLADRTTTLETFADTARYVTLTPAGEVGNSISVAVQVVDKDGGNVAAVTRCVARATAAGNCSLSETGVGAQVGPTQSAGPTVAMYFDTDAAGAATVAVLDDTGVLAGDIVLEVAPVNTLGRPQVAVLAFT